MAYFWTRADVYRNKMSDLAMTASHIVSISFFTNHPVNLRCITLLMEASFSETERNKLNGCFRSRLVFANTSNSGERRPTRLVIQLF
jgi:hypothetical protein